MQSKTNAKTNYLSSMAFTHFHEKIQQLLKNVGVGIAKRLTYQKFVHSWYAFRKLLDVTHGVGVSLFNI